MSVPSSLKIGPLLNLNILAPAEFLIYESARPIFIFPLTSNFSSGSVTPIPTFPEESITILLLFNPPVWNSILSAEWLYLIVPAPVSPESANLISANLSVGDKNCNTISLSSSISIIASPETLALDVPLNKCNKSEGLLVPIPTFPEESKYKVLLAVFGSIVKGCFAFVWS